jgi:hypothetical protein
MIKSILKYLNNTLINIHGQRAIKKEITEKSSEKQRYSIAKYVGHSIKYLHEKLGKFSSQ